MTLLLQVICCCGVPWPSSHLSTPEAPPAFHLRSITAWSGRGSGRAARLGLSGQKPVSMSAMMIPSPAWAGAADPLAPAEAAAGFQLAVVPGWAGRGLGRGGQAGALRQEAGVDAAEVDPPPGMGGVAELLGPGAARSGQAEEAGRGDRVDRAPLVL